MVLCEGNDYVSSMPLPPLPGAEEEMTQDMFELFFPLALLVLWAVLNGPEIRDDWRRWRYDRARRRG